MGGNGSKVIALPVAVVLKRINDCVLPDDKGSVLDYVEMLDISLSNVKTNVTASQQLKEANGILLILKLMKKMIEDSEVVAVCVQVFEAIKLDTPLVMDFIQYGGLDLLEKAMRTHSKDDFISVTVPRLFNVLLAIGAAVSIQEIQNEGLSLQLCQRCQEAIERSKKKDFFQAEVNVPRSCDRVNRVLKFMDNYLARVDVQVVALDAVINFARNPDAKTQARETNAIAVIGRSVTAHATCSEIIWRACMALSLIVGFHGELANDVASLEIHDVLIDSFASFDGRPAIQQQVLWLLASFLQWPKSKRILHRSDKVMAFFHMIVLPGTPTSLAPPPPPPGIQKKKSAAKTGGSSGTSKLTSSAAPIAPEETVAVPTPVVERKEFDLVVPLLIRTFLRETSGKKLNETAPVKTNKPFKARRNFDERPKFGTVEDAIFVKGAEGLLPSGQENEFGEKEREVADWEKKLNYGERDLTIKKKKK